MHRRGMSQRKVKLTLLLLASPGPPFPSPKVKGKGVGKSSSKEQPEEDSDKEEDEEEEPEETEECLGDDDDGDSLSLSQSQSQSSQSKSTKRKRKDPCLLDDATADEVVNWIKDNPMLYNKGDKKYKFALKKKEMWKAKAESINKTYEELYVWYESLRTRYGRLVKTKSGQGAPKLTDREQWIVKSFDFLKGHIHPQPSRQGFPVSRIFPINNG